MAFLTVMCICGDQVGEVWVENATTMRYAALHCADALGDDSEAAKWVLLSYPHLERVPEDELAVQWEGRPVCLAREV